MIPKHWVSIVPPAAGSTTWVAVATHRCPPRYYDQALLESRYGVLACGYGDDAADARDQLESVLRALAIAAAGRRAFAERFLVLLLQAAMLGAVYLLTTMVLR